MLAELVAREIDFDTDEQIAPPVGRHRNAPAVLPSGGRLLRSHEPYKRWYGINYGAVIYVIRDGRDVAVSNYYHHRRRGWYEREFSEFLQLFLAGVIDGYGAWHNHVLSWLERHKQAPGRVMIVKYEDLLHDPNQELDNINEFLSLECDRKRIAHVVANNSIDRMRAKESRSRNLAAQRRTNVPFVRKGVAGGWRELFDHQDEERFAAIAGRALREAGYVLTSTEHADVQLDSGSVPRGGSAA
jgi:hypothetical protein